MAVFHADSKTPFLSEIHGLVLPKVVIFLPCHPRFGNSLRPFRIISFNFCLGASRDRVRLLPSQRVDQLIQLIVQILHLGLVVAAIGPLAECADGAGVGALFAPFFCAVDLSGLECSNALNVSPVGDEEDHNKSPSNRRDGQQHEWSLREFQVSHQWQNDRNH